MLVGWGKGDGRNFFCLHFASNTYDKGWKLLSLLNPFLALERVVRQFCEVHLLTPTNERAYLIICRWKCSFAYVQQWPNPVSECHCNCYYFSQSYNIGINYQGYWNPPSLHFLLPTGMTYNLLRCCNHPHYVRPENFDQGLIYNKGVGGESLEA